MDFWRRMMLPSPARRRDSSPPLSPEARLEKYKRGWASVQKSWAALCNPHSIQHTSAFQGQLVAHIQGQNRLLRERSASKLCLEYTLRQRIVPIMVKIARNSPSQVATEIVQCLVALIDVSDEEFLTHDSVCVSISELAGSFHGGLDDDYREALMELLFNVAATTKVRRVLLNLWFNLDGARNRDAQSISSESAPDNDFPIFYTLLENVPAEGRIGDFAKTGLLYFIELANDGDELEEWILSSDLATMMAAGLGASYSQLPRKIIIVHPPEGTVPTLLSADDASQTVPPLAHLEEYERTDSPAFIDSLDSFLRYLGFWKDVLDHCPSTRIRSSLLDTFKSLFLSQLLYPSLIESSERDSVAILTYLRVILEVLQHQELTHLMLSYLMGDTKDPVPTNRKKKLRRASTMNLLRALPSDDSLANTPQLFSAADLIMGNLKARQEERVIATLRLASTLLKRHCGYTINTLLRTSTHPKTQVTVGHHEKEMELFLGLISPGGLAEHGSQSFDAYVRDAMINLETHPCSEHVLQSMVSPPKHSKAPPVPFHAIRQDDPLMKGLLRLFSSFFTNCVELNLWLTRVIVDLCACRFRSAEGWLLFKPEDGYIEDDAFINTLVPENHSRTADNLLDEFSEIETELNDESDDESVDFGVDTGRNADLAKRKPTFTRFPSLFTMLKTLRAQVAHYKSELADEDFDSLLEERRRALGFLDGISSAMNTAHHTHPRQSRTAKGRTTFASPASTPGIQSSPSRPSRSSSSSSSVPLSGILQTPFSLHFDRTQKLIQPLFPMGVDSTSTPSSPEDSFADLSEMETVDDKRRTGEFEPPEEITMGRLLNNIIVFEEFVKEITALVQCRRVIFEPVKYF